MTAARRQALAEILRNYYGIRLRLHSEFCADGTNLVDASADAIEALFAGDPGATHWDGCWQSGQKHYECAVEEINRRGSK